MDVYAPRRCVTPVTRDLLGRFARGATGSRWFTPTVIPGVLQAEAYARLVMSTAYVPPVPPETQDTLWMLRRAAQQQLHPQTQFIFSEAALHCADRPVRDAQMRLLAELAGRTDIRILPLGTMAPGMHECFILVDPAPDEDGSTWLYREFVALGEDRSTDPEIVNNYQTAWAALESAAAPVTRYL